jgi:signal transduction histidine kinase/ligand-binding sensor domain-containing protein/DNA-binding response OmpR family regulator
MQMIFFFREFDSLSLTLRKIFIFLLSLILINNRQASGQPDNILFARLDINNGLSQNHINCIYKDNAGFVWIGTMAGLNRFDGNTFKIYKHITNDTTSITDNFVNSIIQGADGLIWIGTRNSYNIYDPSLDIFYHHMPEELKSSPLTLDNISSIFCDKNKDLWFLTNSSGIVYYKARQKRWINIKARPDDSSSLSSNVVSSLAQGQDGKIWIINQKGIIELLDSHNLKVIARYYTPFYGKEDNYYSLTIDSDGELWLYSNETPAGLYRFNSRLNKFIKYVQGSNNKSLNNNFIRKVIEQSPGKIWIGTDHGGINILNKKTNIFQYVVNHPERENSISENVVTSLYKDNQGIIWVGTFKRGLNYYHPDLIKFRHYKHELSNPYSIGYDDIDCFAEDKKGNIWIGTNSGGLYYFDRKTEKFTRFIHDAKNPNSLSSNVILKLYVDEKNNLWIGSYYGGLSKFDGHTFKHYRHLKNDPQSLSDDRVWDIFVDSRGNFWVGTLGGGLNLFDPKKGTFHHFRSNASNSVSSDYVLNIAEDGDNNLWFATAVGLNKLDRASNRFVHYYNDLKNPESLSNNNVICVLSDKRGLIWAGTREGLSILDPKTNKFLTFYTTDGLADNIIEDMVEDNLGNIWVGTPSGLTKITVTKNKENKYQYAFLNYDKSDGLQGREFNEKACCKLSTGEILFGGTNGFNIFNPVNIRLNTNIPPVVITNFQIFNQNIGVNQKVNNRILLTKSIIESNKITLKYSENVFSIEFASLNYLHPEKNRYLYRLEGFNNKWLKPDIGQHKVTYTNLNPGTYTFRVIASNDDGIWNNSGTALTIRVLPPFYRTTFALILYCIFLIFVLLLARKIILDRARMQFNIENERLESQRLHELDMIKIKFFTNISHEFRTPLTLIISPIEKMLKNAKDEEQKSQLTLVYRNANRLLRLVNQLLDFRRMEVEEFKLNTQYNDIIFFIKDITYSFSDIAEEQHITYTFSSNVDMLPMYFDPDKVDKILYNLLSNAFKFTPQGGAIRVELEYSASNKVDNPEIKIRVMDTGIGIPKNMHEKIFEQFFQNDVPGNIINQGSGVGLALVKEFVRLHNGHIFVESEPDKGSTFTVVLPVITQEEEHEAQIEEKINDNQLMESYPEAETKRQKSISILIIEDNHDLRFYLKDNLRHKYTVYEAANGNDGYQRAINLIPDLIISDIVLPGMDGVEICKKLKTDRRTSHIPIILLTAHTGMDQKISGFEAGADDYITKPFSFEILESRIRNLIKQREALRKSFQKQIEISPSSIDIISVDEKFIQKAIETVEKNIDNANFSVEELSRELGMSRVNLYKKLLSLTGKTPIEFIRIIRLKRAAQLLKGSQLTISEIAYKVGFNNPKYFTKYFKEEFGVLPSVYAQQNEDKN